MELAILMAGIVYGLIIGLIPAAGATTGLITLFGFMPYFVGDPYLGVIFCVAVVASSTTGDSFNPLHWWPMLWGYEARLPEEDRITIRPIDTDRIMQQHGGKMNVYIVDYQHIKFRRKKDAVIFGLKYF